MTDRFIDLNTSNPDYAILPFIIIGAILLGGSALLCAIEAVREFLKKRNHDAIKAIIRSKTAKTVNVGIFNHYNTLTSVETIECDTSNVFIGEVIYA